MIFPSLTTILDNFNRADGGLGANWTTMAGTMGVTSNQMGAAAVPALARYNVATYGPNVDGFITISVLPSVTNGASILARLSSAANGYMVTYQVGTGILIRRLTGGAPTTLDTTAVPALSAGDKLGIRCRGATIESWYTSGGVWTMAASVTDATYSTANYLAVFLSGTTSRVDDFGGGTMVFPVIPVVQHHRQQQGAIR